MAKRVQINELFDSPDFNKSNDNIGILSVWIPERGKHHTLKMGHVRKIWEENKLTAGIVDQKNVEIVALNRRIAELEKALQPFANYACFEICEDEPDDQIVIYSVMPQLSELMIVDFRNAAKALNYELPNS